MSVTLLVRLNIQKSLTQCMLVKHLTVFYILFTCRYNSIRQNSLAVEYALIEHEIAKIDSLISEVLENLNWNSESESFQLLQLTEHFEYRINQLPNVTVLHIIFLLNWKSFLIVFLFEFCSHWFLLVGIETKEIQKWHYSLFHVCAHVMTQPFNTVLWHFILKNFIELCLYPTS